MPWLVMWMFKLESPQIKKIVLTEFTCLIEKPYPQIRKLCLSCDPNYLLEKSRFPWMKIASIFLLPSNRNNDYTTTMPARALLNMSLYFPGSPRSFSSIPLQIFADHHGMDCGWEFSPISVQLDWLLLSSAHSFYENLIMSPHKILEYL